MESHPIAPSTKQRRDKIIQKIWDVGIRNQRTLLGLPSLNGYRKDAFQAISKGIGLGGQQQHKLSITMFLAIFSGSE